MRLVELEMRWQQFEFIYYFLTQKLRQEYPFYQYTFNRVHSHF